MEEWYRNRYNEALKRAKAAIDIAADKDLVKGVAFTIFPELRESEDERIRKALVWHLKADVDFVSNGVTKAECLAWLEKQKEHQNNSDAPNESSWSGIISSSDKDKNLDEIAQDYVEGVKEYNPEPTWNLMQTAVCYGYHYREEEEQKPVEIHIDNPNIQKLHPNVVVETRTNGTEYLSPDCGTTAGNTESDYDRGYREGKRFQIEQTERYSIGKTFAGLIPCWVNAPSELQPAHKYHGKNVVIMHENNGGFRCVCIDDEKPVTFHLPEDTLFAEGWRKKPVKWGEEDELNIGWLIAYLKGESAGEYYDEMMRESLVAWLKSLRPQPKQVWTEEDDRICNLIMANLSESARHAITLPMETVNDFNNWLRTLQCMPPVFTDWNEEDQTLLSDALGCVTMVQELKKRGELKNFHISCTGEELRSWIRSLKSRPRKQSHWKPSEEQMEALKHYVDTTTDGEIELLYNDLKKLM